MYVHTVSNFNIFYDFLFELFLDCGAGIGRVTKNLLLPLFDTVDMVEQNPDFLEKAKVYLVGKNNDHFTTRSPKE